MKKCSQCNETFEEESMYCSSCGIALIATAEVYFCSQCGQEMTGAENFCPNCGKEITSEKPFEDNIKKEDVEIDLSKNIDEEVDDYHEYRFCKERFSGTKVITNIVTKQNILDITQHKELCYIKYGKQSLQLDIYEITDVITKKKVSGTTIGFMIAGLMMVFLGVWFGWLLMLLGLFMLKSKYLYIYFKNSYISIPEELSGNGDMDALLNHIRKYNPDCVRIYMDN